MYAYIILENCNEMGCEDRRWMHLAQVSFVIAAFVMSGVQVFSGFISAKKLIPNLATNMPTDTVNYFGAWFHSRGRSQV